MADAELKVQLVAEGSSSKRRRLGVAITKARYNFVEGSAFGLRRAEGSVKSKERFSKIKGQIDILRAEGSVQSKESVCKNEGKQQQMEKRPKDAKERCFYRISNLVFSLKISQISKKCANFYISSLFFFRNMMNLHLFYLNLHPNMSIVFKPMDVFFLSRMVNGLIVFY